jgi:hypothetical protein
VHVQCTELGVSDGAALLHPEDWDVGEAAIASAVRKRLGGRDAAFLTGEKNCMQRVTLYALVNLMNN